MIVSQETTPGEEYVCSVTPNDGFDDGNALNSSSLTVKWKIMFNVTSGEDGAEINNIDNITCNYAGFSFDYDTTNPYGPYGFPQGDWTCTFKNYGCYDEAKTFTADDNKIVQIKLSEKKSLTIEEHTWLEALYDCIILKDCDLYNLLIQINTTTSNIWQYTKPTDQSVVTTENLISNIANLTHNITYEYSIKIPNKAGYAVNTYLPVRIGYWFINKDTGKCYSQGSYPSGIELTEPYCQPLMIETIGPMGGTVNFRVDLRPSNLTAGIYNITRSVEIDPNNVWNNYGQEKIGEIIVTEDLPTENSGISTKTTSVNEVKTTEVIVQQSSSGGGGGDGSSSPVTNIYNIYNIEENEEKEIPSQEETKPEEKGLASITGMTGVGLSKSSPLVGSLIIMIIVLGGISSYMLIRKRK